jgi:hypothetical protein
LEDSQLDTMTADCVGRWVADESKRRTLTQWRQQLAGAITRDANSGKRPPKQTGAGREANRREANFGEANFDDAETREREEGIRAQLEARAQAQRTYEPPPGLLEDL